MKLDKVLILVIAIISALCGCRSKSLIAETSSASQEPAEEIGTLSNWQKLYYDFYVTDLHDIESYITGIALLDLDQNSIPELIIYAGGAGMSGNCAVYTVEDDELRAFTKTFPLPEELYVNTVPSSKNAIEYYLFANPEVTQLREDQIDLPYFLSLHDTEDTDSANSVFMLHSENAAGPDDSWGTWFMFGNSEGALVADVLFTHEKVAEYGDDGIYTTKEWRINDKSVSKEEYESKITEFEVELFNRFTLNNFNYGEYCILREECEITANTFYELLTRNHIH